MLVKVQYEIYISITHIQQKATRPSRRDQPPPGIPIFLSLQLFIQIVSLSIQSFHHQFILLYLTHMVRSDGHLWPKHVWRMKSLSMHSSVDREACGQYPCLGTIKAFTWIKNLGKCWKTLVSMDRSRTRSSVPPVLYRSL